MPLLDNIVAMHDLTANSATFPLELALQPKLLVATLFGLNFNLAGFAPGMSLGPSARISLHELVAIGKAAIISAVAFIAAHLVLMKFEAVQFSSIIFAGDALPSRLFHWEARA